MGSMSDTMVLLDMNGHPHKMSYEFVRNILIFGWVFYVMAILTNCIYYVVHPMAPQPFSKDKMKTFLIGHLWECACCKSNKTEDFKSTVGKTEDGEEERKGMLTV